MCLVESWNLSIAQHRRCFSSESLLKIRFFQPWPLARYFFTFNLLESVLIWYEHVNMIKCYVGSVCVLNKNCTTFFSRIISPRAPGDKEKYKKKSRKERERMTSITSFNPLLCSLMFKNSNVLGLWDEDIGWVEQVMGPIVFSTHHMFLCLSLFSSVCTAVTCTPPSSPPSTAGATGSYR